MSPVADMWRAAFSSWAAARREERVYDAEIWQPASDGGALTPAIEAEMERLGDKAWNAEGAIFALPAFNAQQLAMKLLIAFDDGRDADAFLPGILDDCRRFADDTLTRGKLSEIGDAARLVGNHRGWLEERPTALVRAQQEPEDHSPSLTRALVLEQVIYRAPAVTDDDVLMRMLMMVSEVAAGGTPNVDTARTVLREAISHFGVGTTADFEKVGEEA